MDLETRETTIADWISQMTIEEKISQMLHQSPAIERLGIPEYNWWNEGLHGVARNGLATVFPQAIALAACFDEHLMFRIAQAVSDEGRAKYNMAVRNGLRGKYQGLTFWTPNINIFRDPRWGRGQETYGEDPHLTAVLGSASVRGLQGDDPEQLKTAACAKHFAAHSGPEALRHSFDAKPNLRDLHETYLPAFKALVDAGVEAVMGAYNRTLGEACCASEFLMKDILRGRWGFGGHYVSDCWAVRDFHEGHGLTETPEESAALAVNTGCDLNCGCVYQALAAAVETGLVREDQLDESLSRLLRTRFRLGMFDEPGDGPWDGLAEETVRCDRHLDLCLEAAAKSLVLLKNKNDILPLDGSKKKILLIGPSAANLHAMLANYHGYTPHCVTILEGFSEKLSKLPLVSMDYHQGCGMYCENRNTGWTLDMARHADVVVACFGLDNALEGEEGDAIASSSKGDREDLSLPPWQLDYLRGLRDHGTPIVLILTGGSPIVIPDDLADAVVFAWYPGELGGKALADVIFGDICPSGKLPVSFPTSLEELPDYDDYSMEGRTYRYMRRQPQYPFGFGLSYSKFRLGLISVSDPTVDSQRDLEVKVTVSNVGTRDAEEVVQIYTAKETALVGDPNFSLKAFRRISVAPGASKTVTFNLTLNDFALADEKGERTVSPGRYQVIASNCAPFPDAPAKGACVPAVALVSVPSAVVTTGERK